MTPAKVDADTAFQVAERLRVPEPWEVFAERTNRYEIHLNGASVELIRGPILLEGYGVRVIRARDEATGIGFQASTDTSDEGIQATARDAESLSRGSTFPAKRIDLPGAASGRPAGVEVCDSPLWDRPMEYLQDYVDALLQPFDGIRDVVPSFGSVRATLTETTIANSAGLRTGYRQTLVWLEMAVKAEGAAEGRPPGEYWVTESTRRIDPDRAATQVEEWSRYARDAHQAVPSPTGELPVLLPATVLATILPAVLGTRCTGGARLREVAPDVGGQWGNESLNVTDDGLVPWGVGSSPVDDEGTPQRRRTLLDHGKISELLYDVRHAGAFGTQSTGNAVRGRQVVYQDWRRFLHPPSGTSTTLVIGPGDGGSDEELAEAAGEGLWVQQLGWAIPDPYSGAFGGEIRLGYRIHGGRRAEPVRGGTVGGIAMAPPGSSSLMHNLSGIGSTPTLAEGFFGPTLLVKSLTVAGSA